LNRTTASPAPKSNASSGRQTVGGVYRAQRQDTGRNCVSGKRPGHEGFSGENPMKKTKRLVPMFATEAEEAEWWYKNRKIHDKQLLAAVKSGEAQILTKEKLLARIAASKKRPAPVVALRIPAASGLGSKAGRGKRIALPDLHQITVARDSCPARKAKGGINC
jgi:hypothetical protein